MLITVLCRMLVNLIYPFSEPEGKLLAVKEPYCDRCGEPFSMVMLEGGFECSNCLGREWALTQARAAYRAEGKLREILHEFKYHAGFYHMGTLKAYLIEGYDRFFRDRKVDALVPVPMHWLKRWQRGFNQAYELSVELGKARGIPVKDCLKKVRFSTAQATLKRSQRLVNQRGAIQFKQKFDVRGHSLLVIDDVFTTGASTNECALQLMRGGALRVDVLTVARG